MGKFNRLDFGTHEFYFGLKNDNDQIVGCSSIVAPGLSHTYIPGFVESATPNLIPIPSNATAVTNEGVDASDIIDGDHETSHQTDIYNNSGEVHFFEIDLKTTIKLYGLGIDFGDSELFEQLFNRVQITLKMLMVIWFTTP